MKSRLGFKGEDFAGRRRGTDDPTLRDRAWTGERLSEDNDEGGDMDQLLRLLAAKGITLPEDTTEPDLVYHLFCATTALYKGREAAAEEDDETGDQDDAQDSFEDDEDEDTYAGHPGYSLSLTTPDEGQQALIARFSSPGSGSRETSQTLIDRLSR
jgi:hypothetical protein